MRSGIASIHITSASQITDGIITSAKIKDGEIVNADISVIAAIASPKLDLLSLAQTLTPLNDGVLNIGSSVKTFNEIHAQQIEGPARALIMMGIFRG